MTPMIWCGRSLMVSVRRRTAGRRRTSDASSASVSITASGAPGASSAFENQRPISGWTPSVVSTPRLTVNVRTSSGSPPPVTSPSRHPHSTRRSPGTSGCSPRRSTKIASEKYGRSLPPTVCEIRTSLSESGIRQRVDQHGVDDAEDRRGGADAERERQDRRGGEPGLRSRHPRRVPKVIPNIGCHC